MQEDSKTKKALKFVSGFLFRAVTGTLVSKVQETISKKIVEVEKRIQGKIDEKKDEKPEVTR